MGEKIINYFTLRSCDLDFTFIFFISRKKNLLSEDNPRGLP